MPKGKSNHPKHPYKIFEDVIISIVENSKHALADKSKQQRINDALFALFGNISGDKTDVIDSTKKRRHRHIAIEAVDNLNTKKAKTTRAATIKAIKKFYPKLEKHQIESMYRNIHEQVSGERLAEIKELQGSDLILAYISGYKDVFEITDANENIIRFDIANPIAHIQILEALVARERKDIEVLETFLNHAKNKYADTLRKLEKERANRLKTNK